MGYYILHGKLAVPAGWQIWAEWFTRSGQIPAGQLGSRHVANTVIGAITVSTTCLGLDHNYGHGLPLIFETIIFRGSKGDEMWRYSTWQEAEEGHARAVALVRREIIENVQK